LSKIEQGVNHEVKSIRAVNQLYANIRTALMSTLDYKGFRMVAYAAMPLDEFVHIYRTIYSLQKTLVLDLASDEVRMDEQALGALQSIGAGLNLKNHFVALEGGLKARTSVHSTIEVPSPLLFNQ
jgi:hypothetical protein